jgi:hypothetical protein
MAVERSEEPRIRNPRLTHRQMPVPPGLTRATAFALPAQATSGRKEIRGQFT